MDNINISNQVVVFDGIESTLIEAAEVDVNSFHLVTDKATRLVNVTAYTINNQSFTNSTDAVEFINSL